MDNVGYVVLSRQMALFHQMDVVANNIANTNTPGFKAENMLFSEYLAKTQTGSAVSFTQDLATVRDVTQGDAVFTDRALDALIKGTGYFELKTPLGSRYTRSGNFQIDKEGSLVDGQGYKVQGEGGGIDFSEGDTDISIKDDGTVSAKTRSGIEEVRGKLRIVKFKNEQLLHKVGNSMYVSDSEPISALVNDDYQIAQHMLEGSNVNSTSQLTEMIKISRAVDNTSKFMNNIHELQRRTIDTLSKSN